MSSLTVPQYPLHTHDLMSIVLHYFVTMQSALVSNSYCPVLQIHGLRKEIYANGSLWGNTIGLRFLLQNRAQLPRPHIGLHPKPQKREGHFQNCTLALEANSSFLIKGTRNHILNWSWGRTRVHGGGLIQESLEGHLPGRCCRNCHTWILWLVKFCPLHMQSQERYLN